jgi:DNA-binding NarL/FixJ family response regulator
VEALLTETFFDSVSPHAMELPLSGNLQNPLGQSLLNSMLGRMESARGDVTTRIRVAIADPHAIYRDGLRKLISGESDLQVVIEASSPALLLSSLRTTQPDVVLISTPSEPGSGSDVFLMLQAHYPEVKVIVLTNATDQSEFLHNVRLGARGIVQKSTSGPMLLKAIRKVQEGEFWLDRSTTAEVVRHFSASRPLPVPDTRSAEGRFPSLSRREREIISLVTQGLRNKELAEKLGISEQTVKNHLHNIFDKLGVSDRLELALHAIHYNWLEAL